MPLSAIDITPYYVDATLDAGYAMMLPLCMAADVFMPPLPPPTPCRYAAAAFARRYAELHTPTRHAAMRCHY